MANLYSGYVSFDDFETLSSLTDITFTKGTTYTIQIQTAFNDKILVREGTVGKGFIVGENSFQYTAGDDDLYIGRLGEYGGNQVYVNIAG